VNAQTPAIMAALAVVGEAWLAALPDVAAGMAAIDRSLALDGAVWRPWDAAGRAAFPAGLNLAEAMGATYVMRWAAYHNLPLMDETLPVVRALLVLRRAAFPTIPWRPRDPVAEDLQRRIRAMEVAEAPRRPVVRLEPYTAPSDVGRSWR
jgi:hypothetical protein